MLPSSSLIKLVLLAAAATGASETPLAPLARQDLLSCLSSPVGGDAARAQFQDEPDFISKDVNYHNLNLQYKPFAILYPKTNGEISEPLACAVKHKRKVQPRRGGRDFINKCLGGADDVIVVDLKHFNHVSVDKTTGMATVGPGNLLEGLVEGLNNAGRFMPHGSSPTVGVGGETLIVLDGVFEMLDGAGNKSVAKKGDVYFFPAGSMVTFSTSQEVLAFYTVQRARK
ncbi:hypothetical protein B0J15DRAFT_555718 [Fusarium solani]|uniref:FAD-binding PCMH-type domain-containing protein n=1 Tax=Fusarium solani TaxID=169388 RepID=A0A9P9G3I3_FUSSL|nr:uncharacterized protein B0J15DRAFT_555718 [Fusarium solani]KAH7231563.1 hypothetical protein B0J15DRAFT_555718 [Fusarium solani]